MITFREYIDLCENSDIPYTKEVNDFCWRRLGFGAAQLAKRIESRQDRVIQNDAAHTVYKLGKTSIFYRVVEIGSHPGIRIDAIWDDSQED